MPLPRTPPRHVVWITTDHLRYDNLAANGNPYMHTPNLDRLAAGGGVVRPLLRPEPGR